MASRALPLRRAYAPLAAAALGGLALAPATVFAEGPAYRRKPIYEEVDIVSALPVVPTLPLTFGSEASSEPVEQQQIKERGPSPTDRLAVQIGKVRMGLYTVAVAVEDRVNRTMDSAFRLEQSFTGTIASLAPPRESGEKLMPGAIYVLVSAMAGSIVTKNRSVVLRAGLPLALGVAAGWAVLPVTMRNVADLTWTYEQRVPAVANAHLQVRDSIARAVHFAKVHKQVSVQYVDDKVTGARETVEGWVRMGK